MVKYAQTWTSPQLQPWMLQKKCSCGGTCSKCRHEHDNHNHTQGGLDTNASNFRESRFGRDFSQVKLRTDSTGDQLAPERPGFRKPTATDDLTQTDLTVPRAEGDAGTAVPKDAGAPAGAPAPSCCDQAFSKGLAASDYGGVICCNNVKHSCVWPSNMSSALTNAKARSIAIDCARVHEDTHHDDIDCTGADVERPSFKAGKNAKAEECTAYTAEVSCFDSRLADCGGVAECEAQVKARRATKKGQADANCT